MNDDRNLRENMQKEMQTKYMTYKTLEANLANLNRQKELLFSKLMEIQNTIVSIDEMGKGKSDTLFSVGSAAYVKGNAIDRNRVVVEIGAGVAVEKDAEDAKKTLERRKEEIEKSIESTQNEMGRILAMMQRLESEVQQMLVGAAQSARRPKDDDKFRVVSG